MHASEKYYPLRPEFAGRARCRVRDATDRCAGTRGGGSRRTSTRTPGRHGREREGRPAEKLEDHQPSFFSERASTLYLLFDDAPGEETSLSTEGHPLPIFLARDDARVAENDTGSAPRKRVHLARSSWRWFGVVAGRMTAPPPEPAGRRAVPSSRARRNGTPPSRASASRRGGSTAALHGSQHNGAGSDRAPVPQPRRRRHRRRGRRVLDGGEDPGGGRDGNKGSKRSVGGGGGGGRTTRPRRALRAGRAGGGRRGDDAGEGEARGARDERRTGSRIRVPVRFGSSVGAEKTRARRRFEREGRKTSRRGREGVAGEKARSAGQARDSKGARSPRARGDGGERVREDETERVPRANRGRTTRARAIGTAAWTRRRPEAKVLHPRFLWVSAPSRRRTIDSLRRDRDGHFSSSSRNFFPSGSSNS